MEISNLEREPIFDTVTDFFDNMDWEFETIETDLEEHEAGLRAKHTGENGETKCVALVNEASRLFIFYVYCPLDIPEEKVGEIATFITMANYDMHIGNFELDVSDGETRFKTSIDFDQSDAPLTMIRTAISIALAMMDEYLPGIQHVLSGEMNPDQAIDFIEND